MAKDSTCKPPTSQYLAPIIVVKVTEEEGCHSLNKLLKPTFNSHSTMN